MTEDARWLRVTQALGGVDAALRSTGQRLVERRPELESPLLAARDAYARSYVRVRAIANAYRYDAPVEPYRLLQVDPDDIDSVRTFKVAQFRNAGAITGGDWDRSDLRFADLDVYQAYVRHFEDGVPWEDTEFFDRIVRELEAGAVMWGCKTEREFRDRCERLDELYESIDRNGYKSQEELQTGDIADPIKIGTKFKTERLKDEIALHVGRDGELIFEDGRNRLSIAKIQGLDRVPVRILCRHTRWQAIRDAYVRGDEAVRHRGDHPDLRYLEFGSA